MNKQWRSGALFSACLRVSSLLLSPSQSLSVSRPAVLWTECQDCLENELSEEGLQWDTPDSLWAPENNELFPFLSLICSMRYPWQVQKDKPSPLELIKYTEYIQESFGICEGSRDTIMALYHYYVFRLHWKWRPFYRVLNESLLGLLVKVEDLNPGTIVFSVSLTCSWGILLMMEDIKED